MYLIKHVIDNKLASPQNNFLFLSLFQSGNDAKLVVVSVSPQSRASLSAKYKLTSQETAGKLTSFFKKIGMYIIYT